jgi:diguanylate cyclase (GGDEF)-like protein
MAPRMPASIATAVDALPLLVFGAGALLALVQRRARLMVGVIILALADSALVNVGSRSVFDAVAILLPLNIAVVVWLGDENPFAGRGALLFGITLLQAAIVAVLLNPGLAVTESLDLPLVSGSLGTWTGVPRLAFFTFALALGVVLVRLYMHGQPLAAGAAWALVASFVALDGVSAGGPVGVHFAAAGALLLVGATWEPRQKVTTDEVTRLPVRIELQRALRRLSKRYTVAYVEVDDFANFRQEHGVEAAHRILRAVARRLRRLRGHGQAYYCDGPTFAVLFPRTPIRRAMRYLDAVRIKVEDITVDVAVTVASPASKTQRAAVRERTVSVTISAGVAEARAGADPKLVLDAADHALTRARQAGMNRVSR